MAMEVITGYTGERHITPGMDAAVWRSIYGEAMYIANVGSKCAGSMPTNNEFTIQDGVVDMQGYLGYGTTETLPIDNCAAGYRRTDLIACRYEHDAGTNIDLMEYVVIKGIEVPHPTVPVTPAHNTGVIADGAAIVDFPLYKIELDGSTVSFTKLFTVKDLSAPLTKAEVLTALGYQETTLTFTDLNNTAVTKKILVEI